MLTLTENASTVVKTIVEQSETAPAGRSADQPGRRRLPRPARHRHRGAAARRPGPRGGRRPGVPRGDRRRDARRQGPRRPGRRQRGRAVQRSPRRPEPAAPVAQRRWCRSRDCLSWRAGADRSSDRASDRAARAAPAPGLPVLPPSLAAARAAPPAPLSATVVIRDRREGAQRPHPPERARLAVLDRHRLVVHVDHRGPVACARPVPRLAGRCAWSRRARPSHGGSHRKRTDFS